MYKVFIDGSAGTTGLKIHDRLKNRNDIELMILPDSERKDINARKNALNTCDFAFLCLPDAAAIEAVSLVENDSTVLIDTSTAHRVNDDWVYGMPELNGQKDKIIKSHRIANPGCHASGFISLVAPLVENGIIKKDEKLSCFSLTGYSGGGKKMIAAYEDEAKDKLLEAPGMYGLTQMHKHLPEMKKICKLDYEPVFCPVVAPYYSGMQVTVPLFNTGKADIADIYKSYYNSGLIKFVDESEFGSTLYAGDLSGKDNMLITVCGNDDRLTLVSKFDNLGKGASGAAIQNLNILMNVPEDTGLITE